MITSETFRTEAIGDGIVTRFNRTFPVQNKNHVRIILTDTDGASTDLTVDVDYTVNGVGETASTANWNMDLAVAPPDGYRVTVIPNLPLTQLTDYENQGGFFADTHERSFDYLTLIDQQLLEKLQRCLSFPAADPSSSVGEFPGVESRKGKLLGFDSETGQPQMVEPSIATPGFETVETGNIAPQAVTAAKIANATITAAKIVLNTITNALLAQVASKTVKGRTSAGTGNVEDLTMAQLTADLSLMGQASAGAGGAKGLVPASSAGDQEKYLRADRSWGVPNRALTTFGVYTPGTSNFVVPANVTEIEYEVLGGGGAGGGVSAASYRCGGSGSGGTYAKGRLTGLTPGATIVVTVGAGGTGSSNANGGAGGQSSLGAYVICPGGLGGTANAITNTDGYNSTAPGAAASGSASAPISARGSHGFSEGSQVSVGVYTYAGFGGSSALFPGPRVALPSSGSSSAGTDATNPGCGGTGAGNGSGANAQKGGDGGPGLVVIKY